MGKNLPAGYSSGSGYEPTMNILHVGTADISGGAEKVAWNLFQSHRSRGHGSWLAVGRKLSNDADIVLIPNHELRGGWARFWSEFNTHLEPACGRVRGAWRLCDMVDGLAEPGRWLDRHRGVEDFHFPGTWDLLKISPRPPDILHLHNLHGAYFDLRALHWLSQQLPVVVTLHDAWLLSGHCAHSFDCDRWKIGCGKCPDLNIYPAIMRDATAYNWQRKEEIYSKSRIHVATPSRWLMDRVEESALAPAVVNSRIIHNGVDLSVFRPADKRRVRAALGLPEGVTVLLFTANRVRLNIWKDYSMMRAAVAQLAEHRQGRSLLFIALGEDAPAERIGQAEVRFVPFQRDPAVVARYYQAADIYIHGARAEVWGLTITEALACGTPVVATAVGGIPEQVRGLGIVDGRSQGEDVNTYTVNEATGIVVPPGDAAAMSVGIERLLNDDPLRRRLGENAATDACQRFDLQRQAETYLDWYEELLNPVVGADHEIGQPTTLSSLF
jgi:glycosyltransferase involved in cell wall biosynthesis